MALLRAQRREAPHRDNMSRDTPEWIASTSRLDGLNDQIMRVGASAWGANDPVGDGLELDLDSRPVEDAAFRREVVASIRHAVTVVKHRRRLRRRLPRLTAGERRLAHRKDLVTRTQAALRKRYPEATIRPAPSPAACDTIQIRADRDGEVRMIPTGS